MARVPNLALTEDLPSLSQKMMGGALATAWCRSDTPPLGADKIGYYAAAYSSGPVSGGSNSVNREKLARCLVWSDCERGRYNPYHFPAYRESALAFPDDERSQFFVAALLYFKAMTDPGLLKRVYLRILAPEWRTSPYWRTYELPDRRVLTDLASLFCDDADNLELEQVAVLELALARCESNPPRSEQRQKFASGLCRAYRKQKRTDAAAEEVYFFVFQHQPEDADNNSFLAEMLVERTGADSGGAAAAGDHAKACAVYARQAAALEMRGEKRDADAWIIRLARAYIALGRIDDGSRAVLGRAAKAEPHDASLAAAFLYASARINGGTAEPSFVMLLEDALAREEEIAPQFAARKWEWGAVVRALSISYGLLGRTDAAACSLYARAVEMNPRDQELWGYHARAEAINANYSEAAIEIYEKALGITRGETRPKKGEASGSKEASVPLFTDDTVVAALAQAYLQNKAFEGIHRPQAIIIWETLYRQKKATEPMVDALVQAYIGEERINDIALPLWERVMEKEPTNGLLRLRLAQEWKMRRDFDLAGRYYKEAIKLLPKDFTAQYEYALFLKDHRSDFTTALRLLQKAVKLPEGKKHLAANVALGETLLAKGKREEARDVFQHIISDIDSRHTETLLLLAQLSLKYEEHSMQQAETLYSQARTQSPEHPEPYKRMADLYHEKGQPEEEQQALEKYLALAEPDAERYRQLADLYIQRGDYTKAEGALRQVIALGDSDKKLFTLLGEVILQSRQSAA